MGSLTISGTGYTITGSTGITATLSGTIDSSQTSGNSTLNLPVGFGTTAGTISVDNTAATLTMRGVISGSAGLTKHGSGVLDLTANNTYTGGTTVSAGTVLVDGSRRRHGRPQHRLPRWAAMGTVGAITSTAATVSPGDSADVHRHPDRFRRPDPGYQLELRRHPQRHHGRDELRPVGRRRDDQPGRALNISTGSFVPTVGNQFTVLHNTSGSAITGTFANLPENSMVAGDGYTFTISYAGGTDGQDVVLTAVAAAHGHLDGDGCLGHHPQRQLVRRQ